MKLKGLTTTVAVILLISFTGLQAQNVPVKLDQQKLILQFLGTWQANAGKDTLEVWDFQQYGKAIMINVSLVIKGKKMPLYLNNAGFDSKEGKFKGYTLMSDGSYGTWIGSFISEKKFEGNDVTDFNSAMTFAKFGCEVVNPAEWTWSTYTTEGAKSAELHFRKVR